jgi:PAS domain S-box-containing protein
MTSAKVPVTDNFVAPAGDAELDAAFHRARLAAIVESSEDAIVSKTLEGVIQSWNASATRIFGYRPEEVIGKHITIIIPQELHQEEYRILERLRRGESIEHFDTVRLTKDGQRIPISLTISPIRDTRGKIIGASKIARDISGRKRAEQVLLESERRLAAEVGALKRLHEWSTRLWRSRNLEEGLEEVLTAAIELLGADKGHLQLLNGGHLEIVVQRGFTQQFLNFFTTVGRDDISCCARALRTSERLIIEDIEADAGSAPLLPVYREAGFRAVVSTPLLNSDGTVLGMVSTHFRHAHRPADQELRRLDLYLRQACDFVQRSSLENRLRQNDEALRDADRRKNEFLALLAHELRNPLAPIRYALAAARRQRSAEQQRWAQDVVERQVTHMSRLLDDLLDISRITHGTLELKKVPTELATIIGNAIETARPLLDAKQHQLILDLPAQPVQFEADPLRLAQVFSNLLLNAAKYTGSSGRIELSAKRNAAELTVKVRDNGIGISPGMMPRLFTLFAQERPSQHGSAPESGLGVGLALVRGLVALHGGRVEAHSAGPGSGSEFTVRLPAETPLPAQVQAEVDMNESPAGNSLQVLIVDDNRDAADSCAMLLELSGHAARTAYCAQQALELGGQLHPDVLLLDIGLPDLNGYELARRIRASDWGQNVALIAVTGWGQESDRKQALEAGFDQHLTKPIAPEALTSLLQSLRPGHRSAPGTDATISR